jgi:hypothetical protein
MAKSKSVSAFSRFSKQQLIVAAIFILGFGGFGVYKLAFSSAARPSSSLPVYTWIGDSNLALRNDPTTTVVQDNVAWLGLSNMVNVVQLSGGKSANFAPQLGGGNPTPLNTCYYVRAVNDASTISITSGTSSQTVTLPAHLNGYTSAYQKVCLQYGAKGSSYPTYHVKHVSGGAVNVLYQIVDFNEG